MQRVHGHGDGVIRRPRLYDYGAVIGFFGRRRRVNDDLVARSSLVRFQAELRWLEACEQNWTDRRSRP